MASSLSLQQRHGNGALLGLNSPQFAGNSISDKKESALAGIASLSQDGCYTSGSDSTKHIHVYVSFNSKLEFVSIP